MKGFMIASNSSIVFKPISRHLSMISYLLTLLIVIVPAITAWINLTLLNKIS